MEKLEIRSDIKKKIIGGKLRLGGSDPAGHSISFTNYYMELNQKPFFGISGEFHFSRYPYLLWEEEILKMKMTGVNNITTYIFWIHHEEEEGVFNWENNYNIRYFVDLCAKHGMYVILRIGPFCHGECRNGGLPDWLLGHPLEVRSNDPVYIEYVARLYREIGKQVSGQMFKDGGPIIGIQLENEHMHASAPWEFMAKQGDVYLSGGRDGSEHIRELKKLAVEAGLVAPIYTCTGWGGASILLDETLPMYGGYSYCPWNINEYNPIHTPTIECLFQDYHNNESKSLGFNPPYNPEDYPYICCEMGGGMICWYGHRFTVPPESVEAQTVVEIASGCNFIGYYLFHDGINPVGKHGYLNECVTPKMTYSYQSPLGEYGQVRKSCKYIKLLFYFVKEFEQLICPMATVLPKSAHGLKPEDADTLRFAARTDGSSGFLFLNNFQDHLVMHEHTDISIDINLPQETITIPHKGGFTLKRDVSAILPFNMDMDGVFLKYATAQLVCSIMNNEIRTYFFFTPEGMYGEYCFDSSFIGKAYIESGEIKEIGDFIFATVNPGKSCVITLALNNGNSIKICTLTREQALRLWKVELWGRENVILSDADVLVSNGCIELYNTGCPDISFDVFPCPEGVLSTGYGSLVESDDGIFRSFNISLSEKTIALEILIIDSQKTLLKFPTDMFEGVKEVFLRIDYRGDVGNAFIGGKLINDNFCNGATWEIGLKRYCPDVLEKGIYLYITPQRKGKMVVSDSAMAIKQEFRGEQILGLDSVEAVPQYCITVMHVKANDK